MQTFKSDRLFHITNNTLLILLSLTMIAPIIHLAAVSLSSPVYAEAKLVYFWPKGLNLDVYQTILGMDMMWRSMGVSVYITVLGTLITLFFTSTLAYSLSRPAMPGRSIMIRGIIVTYVFLPPLIPTYLLVKSLGLENTLWSLMLPFALNAFYIMIMRTYYLGISNQVFDSAKIDGCSELGILWRIAIPLSKPVIATIALFHAVYQWNSYFYAIIFIRSKELYPLQVLLRNLVVEEEVNSMPQMTADEVAIAATPEMMKAGIIIFATIPILAVYPFLQKYFVKGAMLGSLKE
jgi:putative aldouronate transport system permease protein